MERQRYTEDQLVVLIRESVEGQAGAGNPQGGAMAVAGSSSKCARYRRIEREQWKFVMLYQTLIWVLAVAAGSAVVITILFALFNVPWQQTALSGATAAVSGGLIAFPVAQRKDARREHAAAVRALKESGCDG